MAPNGRAAAHARVRAGASAPGDLEGLRAAVGGFLAAARERGGPAPTVAELAQALDVDTDLVLLVLGASPTRARL